MLSSCTQLKHLRVAATSCFPQHAAEHTSSFAFRVMMRCDDIAARVSTLSMDAASFIASASNAFRSVA